MPKATVSTEATRYDLKSCPGGFVTLKPFSFGDMLKRRDRAAKYTQRGGTNGDSGIQIDILNEFSRKYDFPRCIVDHNLEDDQGQKLDFSETFIDMTLTVLDPKIGAEIERLVDAMNQEETDTEGFTGPSAS